MKIVLSADHGGVELKRDIASLLTAEGHEVLDLGTDSAESVDYPDKGREAAEAIVDGRAEMGVIICGSGIGISIAANRIPGVRAAVCHDVTTARLARAHNNANILSIGARIVGKVVAEDMVNAFLNEPFEGGRHARRVDLLG